MRLQRQSEQIVPRARRIARHRLGGALSVALALACCIAGSLAAGAGASTASGTPAAVGSSGAAITAHGEEFLSPSRNISCEIDWHIATLPSVAYCQTLSPPRSVTLSPSGGIKTCSGMRCIGNPAENAEVLPYLTSTSAGPFLCTSRIDGVACSAAGLAFLIARSGIVTYSVLAHTTTAIYTDSTSHRTLALVSGYGWLLAIDRAGRQAEIELECGSAGPHLLPRGRLWTIELSAVKSFELETNPADMAAGSVVDVSRPRWVSEVRVNGWNGYLELDASDSFLTDGPGPKACAG
ncbi:MAG TPA: hypothetical protein VMD59_13220 [Acidimicrobiales bacterium]|nr:hypothetical protein [Acidimicrobiales bacterium]